jgi:hypothetical protein
LEVGVIFTKTLSHFYENLLPPPYPHPRTGNPTSLPPLPLPPSPVSTRPLPFSLFAFLHCSVPPPLLPILRRSSPLLRIQIWREALLGGRAGACRATMDHSATAPAHLYLPLSLSVFLHHPSLP